MGLSIVVTDYSGKVFARIYDPRNFLHKLFPPSDEESATMLAKIDWYGDTCLNYLQIGQFLGEWDQLSQRTATSEFARACSYPHSHLTSRRFLLQ
jgi:hypothetical protein